MKQIFFALFFLFIFNDLYAARYITFCYWSVSAIVESVNKNGIKEYSVHYKGNAYTLTLTQYADLLDGKDVTLKID